MDQSDIGRWVEQAPEWRTRQFRAAVHTVLVAISLSEPLHERMIMKGGMLLAVHYNSRRFTRDIDFSTSQKRSDFDAKGFLDELKQALALAVEKLHYGLDCRIQSHAFKPPTPEATFPTLKIRIAYADKGNPRARKRLLAGNGTDVVEVDYSLNEDTHNVEPISLRGGGIILAYSLGDLIAEKFRAILQQKVRDRYRRQDVFDLHFLITSHPVFDSSKQAEILKCLLTKSASRNVKVDQDSMKQEDIIERSKKEFKNLALEIEWELPEFEELFSVVKQYYEGLPWEELNS